MTTLEKSNVGIQKVDGNRDKKTIDVRGEDGKNLQFNEKESEILAKYSKEKASIIYLTEDELTTLRSLLNGRPDSEENLMTFIEQQEKETVTTSEILDGTETVNDLGGIEKLKIFTDILEKASYNHFFEGDGILSKMNFSIDAKRNFAVGANFYMMDYLFGEIESNGSSEDIQGYIKTIFGEKVGEEGTGVLNTVMKAGGSLSSLKSGLELLLDDTLGKNIGLLTKSYDPEKEKVLAEALTELNLGDSEEQAIFMNPFETKKLLDFVYKGKTKEEIIDYININNGKDNLVFGEDDKKELQKVGEKVSQVLGKQSLGILGNATSLMNNINNIKGKIVESISGNKEMLGVFSFLSSVPLLGDFVKMFLNFLGISDVDKLLTGKDFETSKKVISSSIIEKGSIFEAKKIGEDFMKVDGKDDTDFVENIKYLVGKEEGEDFEEGVLDFFKKDSEFEKFVKNENVNIDLTGKTIDYKKLKEAVSLFKEFKIAQSKDENLTIELFIIARKKVSAENKKSNEEALELQKKSQTLNNTEVEKPEDLEKQKKYIDEKIENILQSLESFLENELSENIKTKINKLTEKLENLGKKVKKLKDNGEELKKLLGKTEKELVSIEAEISELNKQLGESNKGKIQIPDENDLLEGQVEGQEKTEEEIEQIEKEKKELIEKLTVKGPEKLEMGNLKIEAVFKIGQKFYSFVLIQGQLTLKGDGKIKIYNCDQKIIDELLKYNGRLDKQAIGSDFGQKGLKGGVELGNHTIKDILINGLNEEVGITIPLIGKKIGETVQQDGLKKLVEVFFKDGNFSNEAVSLEFGGVNYEFNSFDLSEEESDDLSVG